MIRFDWAVIAPVHCWILLAMLEWVFTSKKQNQWSAACIEPSVVPMKIQMPLAPVQDLNVWSAIDQWQFQRQLHDASFSRSPMLLSRRVAFHTWFLPFYFRSIYFFVILLIGFQGVLTWWAECTLYSTCKKHFKWNLLRASPSWSLLGRRLYAGRRMLNMVD